jgi:hypothetical protein
MLDATSNVHLQFREQGSNGTSTYEPLEDLPNQYIVRRIVDHDLGYAGSAIAHAPLLASSATFRLAHLRDYGIC